jgi:Cupin domain
MPSGLGPPTHRHRRAHEGFYILEGTCGFNAEGKTHEVGPGTYIHLPRMTPHNFSALSDEVCALNFYTPAGFELLVMSFGRLAEERRRPSMAESAPPPAEQVRILSALFGDQEAVTALAFAQPPTEALMVTEAAIPGPAKVHIAFARVRTGMASTGRY